MYKHWNGLKKSCFEMFTRLQVVNMKTVMGLLRISEEFLSSESRMILRNFQYWAKLLFSYKKYVFVLHKDSIDVLFL